LKRGQSLSLPADTDAIWLSVLLLVSVSVVQVLLNMALLNPSRSRLELAVVDFSMTSSLSFEMFSFKFDE
jgi:hypothetical protein